MKGVASAEDVELLNNFIIEHYEREQNNLIRDNDQCMRRHSKVSQYWEAKMNRTMNPGLHTTTAATSASIVQRPSFIVLMACFVLMVFFSYK